MKKSNIGRRVVKGIGNGIFALVLLFCLALSVSFLLLDGNTFWENDSESFNRKA